jgi:flagellar hook protein FlgE
MQTALSGMNAATLSLQVAANNLANQQTTAFKAGRPQFSTMSAADGTGGLGQGVTQTVGGVQVSGMQIDQSQAAVELADDQPALWTLQGEGLFILERASGERYYSRDGRFRFNADGELVTTDGLRVMGFEANAHGPVDTAQLVPLRVDLSQGAPALTRFTVSRDGRLVGYFSNGTRRVVGQVRLARFANPSGLLQRGGNLCRAMPASGLPREVAPAQAGAAEIIGGASELSNTDLGRELIELALAGNHFRANLAVVQTADALLGELFFPYHQRLA